MIDVLLFTPPFTQLNTPYPGTAYLKGFLNTKNISCHQVDLGIEVILQLFSKKGLQDLLQEAKDADHFVQLNAVAYLETIDDTISFLQGNQPELQEQFRSLSCLPMGPRFDHFDPEDWSFENLSASDQAKHIATLYLEDLGDFIQEAVDANFGFSRYAERLGRSANSFDDLSKALTSDASYIDNIAWSILQERIQQHQPKLVGASVPFPGNLYSAFRMAKEIKTNYPAINTCLGGGFPNTELRQMTEQRVAHYFDYVTLDDGELPLEILLNAKNGTEQKYKRTYLAGENQLEYQNDSPRPDYQQHEVGTPDYSDLPLDRYISVIEMANPMHSLWSDGRWNKLTMAHGCYWAKCTFCDTSLPYISDYEANSAKLIVDRMEELIQATGENGFHFVDEAAPPKIMKAVASEIIQRNLDVKWWANVRFEKSFNKELCLLLAASGCIAVSGGLEVASNRLLELIDKGISVEQVSRVCDHLSSSGIMVHAYLMYGYPTQTVQETIDSLEMVRQLFDLGLIQSAFWHRFALTAHSPIGQDPEKYGLNVDPAEITFAHNDIVFEDSTGIDHDVFQEGLNASLYNYMHDNGFDIPLQEWFAFDIPATTVPADYIDNYVTKEDH